MGVKYFRYKPPPSGGPLDDPTPDYMNLLGMIFSMCGLMLKVRSCRQKHINVYFGVIEWTDKP